MKKRGLSRSEQARWHASVIAALPHDIDGQMITKWMAREEALKTALRMALDMSTRTGQSEPTWKLVELGTVRDGKHLLRALCAAGYRVTPSIIGLMEKTDFVVANCRTRVELVHVSLRDLGLKKGANYTEVCERGVAAGLALCPTEVGPQLRAQYDDQPRGEWIRVATDTSLNLATEQIIAKVGNAGGALTLGEDYVLNTYWRPDDDFVFLRNK